MEGLEASIEHWPLWGHVDSGRAQVGNRFTPVKWSKYLLCHTPEVLCLVPDYVRYSVRFQVGWTMVQVVCTDINVSTREILKLLIPSEQENR